MSPASSFSFGLDAWRRTSDVGGPRSRPSRGRCRAAAPHVASPAVERKMHRRTTLRAPRVATTGQRQRAFVLDAPGVSRCHRGASKRLPLLPVGHRVEGRQRRGSCKRRVFNRLRTGRRSAQPTRHGSGRCSRARAGADCRGMAKQNLGRRIIVDRVNQGGAFGNHQALSSHLLFRSDVLCLEQRKDRTHILCLRRTCADPLRHPGSE